MAGYRLYFLGDSGHIKDVAEFECDADEEAMGRAELLHDGRPMELWRGTRIVKKISGRPLD